MWRGVWGGAGCGDGVFWLNNDFVLSKCIWVLRVGGWGYGIGELVVYIYYVAHTYSGGVGKGVGVGEVGQIDNCI